MRTAGKAVHALTDHRGLQKMADQDNQTNPFMMPDFAEMMRQMQMPGVDFESLMREGQKNIEAVQEANRAVAEGWQAMTQKQMEIFQQTMQQWAENMQAAASGDNQADAAREGFEQALANMQELAQIAADSQMKAMDIMRQRFEENMRNMMPGGNQE